jgi:hypothetical protein
MAMFDHGGTRSHDGLSVFPRFQQIALYTTRYPISKPSYRTSLQAARIATETLGHFWDSNGQPLMIGRTPLLFRSTQKSTDLFRRFFADAETFHMFGPGEFEQVLNNEVKAVWGMEDQIFLKSTANFVGVRGGGYYYEIWRLKDGEWYLKSLDLRRTYTQMSLMARAIQLYSRA